MVRSNNMKELLLAHLKKSVSILIMCRRIELLIVCIVFCRLLNKIGKTQTRVLLIIIVSSIGDNNRVNNKKK